MTNHENRGNPGITYPEISATLSVLGDVDPAHFEAYPPTYEANVKSAQTKMGSLPRGSVLIPFSRKELELLWHVIGNGMGDDTINNLGLRSDEKKTVARAANRIALAGKCGGPRFYE